MTHTNLTIFQETEEDDPEVSYEETNPNYIEPALYSWFYKMRAGILSKQALYFNDTIRKNASHETMKEKSAHLTIDYATK